MQNILATLKHSSNHKILTLTCSSDGGITWKLAKANRKLLLCPVCYKQRQKIKTVEAKFHRKVGGIHIKTSNQKHSD
jgi:hypothetical protein